jgi:hypothetical protein
MRVLASLIYGHFSFSEGRSDGTFSFLKIVFLLLKKGQKKKLQNKKRDRKK